MTALPLPVVVVPVTPRVAALDACLGSLERTLPGSARVLIADQGGGDPQAEALARRWCDRSRLNASFTKLREPGSLADNVNEALAECADDDVVVLQADAVTTQGWLERMAQYSRKDPRIATVSAWSNRGELVAFPRNGDENPAPEFPEAIAEAASAAPWNECPDLPAASGPAILFRREALTQLRGLDANSYDGERVFDDFSRRAASMGWRNVFCPAAFVVRQPSVAAAGVGRDDLGSLLARWPDYQEQVARFLLSDPLRPLRERLLARKDELARGGPQRDLFGA
jgi:GT2 family glycosyltransferase